MKYSSVLLVGLQLLITGCGLRFQVWNQEALSNLQTVIVVPIAVGETQKELSGVYFPGFQKEVVKTLAGNFNILPVETVQKQISEIAQDRDFTWEIMAEVGKQLQADALIGLMIEESDIPGRLIEHIKVVSAKNGKILASNNFLFKASSQHRFQNELSELKTLFRKTK